MGAVKFGTILRKQVEAIRAELWEIYAVGDFLREVGLDTSANRIEDAALGAKSAIEDISRAWGELLVDDIDIEQMDKSYVDTIRAAGK